MKCFVRNYGVGSVVIAIITLTVTSLAGGSEAVFYATAIACMAVFLWREGRRGAL
jgi:hypothetical protein